MASKSLANASYKELVDLHNENSAKYRALQAEVERYNKQLESARAKNMQTQAELEMMRRQLAAAQSLSSVADVQKTLLAERMRQQQLQMLQQQAMEGHSTDPTQQHLQMVESTVKNQLAQLDLRAQRGDQNDASVLRVLKDDFNKLLSMETLKAQRVQEYNLQVRQHQALMQEWALVQHQYLLVAMAGGWLGQQNSGRKPDKPKHNSNKGKLRTVSIPIQLELTTDAFIKQVLTDSLWVEDSETDMVAMAFSTSGRAVLALADDGTMRYWQYCPCLACMDPEAKGKGYSSSERLWSWHQAGLRKKSGGGLYAKMAINVRHLPESMPCSIVLSQNENYMLTLYGGTVFLFNLVEAKHTAILHQASTAATAVAFHPRDSNMIAIGLVDGTLILTNTQKDHPLRQACALHSGAITSIVFLLPKRAAPGSCSCCTSCGCGCQTGGGCGCCSCSCSCCGGQRQGSYVVTAGADGSVVRQKLDEIDKVAVDEDQIQIDLPTEGRGAHEEDEWVYLDLDGAGELLLVQHSNQIITYKVHTMERQHMWAPASLGENMGDFKVWSAKFSSCGKYIYGTLSDGSVLIFRTNALMLLCRCLRGFVDEDTAPGLTVKLLVPHPKPEYSSCFALALSDGSVQIWKPKEGPRANWDRLASCMGGIDAMTVLNTDFDRYQAPKKVFNRASSPRPGHVVMDLNSAPPPRRSSSPLPHGPINAHPPVPVKDKKKNKKKESEEQKAADMLSLLYPQGLLSPQALLGLGTPQPALGMMPNLLMSQYPGMMGLGGMPASFNMGDMLGSPATLLPTHFNAAQQNAAKKQQTAAAANAKQQKGQQNQQGGGKGAANKQQQGKGGKASQGQTLQDLFSNPEVQQALQDHMNSGGKQVAWAGLPPSYKTGAGGIPTIGGSAQSSPGYYDQQDVLSQMDETQRGGANLGWGQYAL